MKPETQTKEPSAKPYISFSSIGMPMRNQIDATRGVSAIFNYLDNHYESAKFETWAWFNKENTVKVEVTGCTVFSDIIFFNLEKCKWRIDRKISFQDFYNEIKGNNKRYQSGN
jgi:hypothetical protein